MSIVRVDHCNDTLFASRVMCRKSQTRMRFLQSSVIEWQRSELIITLSMRAPRTDERAYSILWKFRFVDLGMVRV